MKRFSKITVLLFGDAVIINLAYIIALLLRLEFDIYSDQFLQFFNVYINHAIAVTAITILIFYIVGMYKSLWRYASIDELMKTILASMTTAIVIYIYFNFQDKGLPRSVYIITFILDVLLIGGFRLSYRIVRRIKGKGSVFLRRKPEHNVMVIGVGAAGAAIIKEMRLNADLKSVVKVGIDDDQSKWNKSIMGVPIVGGTEKIIGTVEKYEIDEIILAIPSVNRKRISEILEICSKTGCHLRTLPSITELIDGQVSITKLRKVKIEDLLGRDVVQTNVEEMSEYIRDKVVLITGAGGSIGSEICRQIVGLEPKKIVALDSYENNLFNIQNEIIGKYKDIEFEAVIGSVRDEKKLKEIFERYSFQVVFHAAAHKHVPLMESEPKEAIKNNVFGTQNLLKFADQYKLERFVLISTDKAVNPTNVMGATKRTAEMLMQQISKKSDTVFTAVRFGNVLGSNGSVIPTFRKQIEMGGPVTVTHAEVTRYFMTIPEAVQLVIRAGSMATGGEIFILDMGKPVKIMDLAENLIRLSGFEPYDDIDIKITGLRPGEKLYEELLLAEEGITETNHEKIFIGKPIYYDENLLNQQIQLLKQNIDSNDNDFAKEVLKKIVVTYSPS